MPTLSTALFQAAMLFVLTLVISPAHSQSSGLPDGDARQLVESVCSACHNSNRISRSS